MTLTKKTIQTLVTGFVAVAFVMTLFAPKADAATYYYQTTTSNDAYIKALVAQINALLRQLESNRSHYSYDYDDDYGYYNGGSGFNNPYSIRPGSHSNRSNNSSDDDIPEVTTEEADDIDENSADIEGDIEMNDYENGIAFFVYGEDESEIEDVEDESEYRDVESDGDDIQKILLSSSLDDDRTFTASINNLDEDTDYFFRICVEYDDEDDDETLVCGDVESFTTDEN